jgi:hypothetical protein
LPQNGLIGGVGKIADMVWSSKCGLVGEKKFIIKNAMRKLNEAFIHFGISGF